MPELTAEQRLKCTEGWKYIDVVGRGAVNKQHYFIDGYSACGRYMTFGAGGCTPDDHPIRRQQQKVEKLTCRRSSIKISISSLSRCR